MNKADCYFLSIPVYIYVHVHIRGDIYRRYIIILGGNMVEIELELCRAFARSHLLLEHEVSNKRTESEIVVLCAHLAANRERVSAFGAELVANAAVDASVDFLAHRVPYVSFAGT